jgi:hypothetical protein
MTDLVLLLNFLGEIFQLATNMEMNAFDFPFRRSPFRS